MSQQQTVKTLTTISSNRRSCTKIQECSSDNIRRTDFTTHTTEDTQQLEYTRPSRKVNAHPDNNGDKVNTEEDSCTLITTHNKIQDTRMVLLGRNHLKLTSPPPSANLSPPWDAGIT